MDIGTKIKEARLAAQLTQEQVAESLGVSRQTMSNWENNKTYPDIVSVIRMSDLYNVSLDHLLKEKEGEPMSNYMNYLEESNNTVTSQRKLSLTILLATYLGIWAFALIPIPKPMAEKNAPTKNSSKCGALILVNEIAIMFFILNVAYSASICIAPNAMGASHFFLPGWLFLPISSEITRVATGRMIHKNTRLYPMAPKFPTKNQNGSLAGSIKSNSRKKQTDSGLPCSAHEISNQLPH